MQRDPVSGSQLYLTYLRVVGQWPQHSRYCKQEDGPVYFHKGSSHRTQSQHRFILQEFLHLIKDTGRKELHFKRSNKLFTILGQLEWWCESQKGNFNFLLRNKDTREERESLLDFESMVLKDLGNMMNINLRILTVK